jgi:hypothetical protein
MHGLLLNNKEVRKMANVNKLWEELDNCTSIKEIMETIKTFPIASGHWEVSVNDANSVTVTNSYWDNNTEEICSDVVDYDFEEI